MFKLSRMYNVMTVENLQQWEGIVQTSPTCTNKIKLFFVEAGIFVLLTGALRVGRFVLSGIWA